MLTRHGGVRAEFTVYKAREGGFYLVSAGALERHDHDFCCASCCRPTAACVCHP